MSVDEEQNRRIGANAEQIDSLKTRVATVETEIALTGQKVDTLSTTFGTGMTDLKDVLRARDEEAREARTTEREDAKIEAAAKREEARWYWGKVFGIVGSLLTLGGASGTAVWYTQAPEAAEAPAAAPAPASTPQPVDGP